MVLNRFFSLWVKIPQKRTRKYGLGEQEFKEKQFSFAISFHALQHEETEEKKKEEEDVCVKAAASAPKNKAGVISTLLFSKFLFFLQRSYSPDSATVSRFFACTTFF